ncbi:MAG TPA: DUF4097 family beta strand repeat-containing protein [Acidobacteriaceae bacterium]|jgi:hypothetical protein
MTRRSLFTATIVFALATSVALAADFEATFDKTLTVSGAPTVSISTGAGTIHVTAGTDNQVHIVGHVRSRDGDDSAVKQIAAAPPIAQSDNTITIGASQGNSDLYRHVSIDYDVTTPRSTVLTARSGSGDVGVAGLAGALSANSGSGSLHLTVTGTADVKAQTGSGSINLDGVAAGLRAGTGSGSIEVIGSPNADWTLRTGSGNIHLKVGNNARFTLDASTGSGSVHVDQPMATQGSANRHHVSGTVNGGGSAIRAATGSGDVIINGASTVSQR